MAERYEHEAVETKWRARWAEAGLFRAALLPDPSRKFYALEMFPYPSGDIHMGHFWNYGLGDAFARWALMHGKDVLHPFGWDAFGLPAENAAIKHGTHPREWTLGNIATSRATLQAVGLSLDWEREFATCLPDYYKFTQWMFLVLHERGLAYRKDAAVNWCPGCSTVLANEQVEEGRCWRCSSEVGKRDLEQWYIGITKYADRLLDGLDTLPEWPRSTVASQRNWIGRSEGAEISFAVPTPQGERRVVVFTTRPDTLWGVTFVTVAPESEFGRFAATSGPNAAEVAAYAAAAAKKTEMERTATDKEKTGVRSGFDAIHPVTGERVPVLVADYALAHYGTGCVMGVPAHDVRDFRFAKTMGLPVKVVVLPPGKTSLDPASMDDAWTERGTLTNSPPFDGQDSDDAIPKIIAWLAERGVGKARVTFRLRDWLISRQRYWGCPIPMIHCKACGIVPVPKEDLPVRLPDSVKNWIPKGRSPLADVPEFMDVKCPKCGAAAQRDADTMDTFICSSWYHLRYTDPRNTELPFAKDKADAWLPVDLYIGGAEHANGHLLYFRFMTKVLHDAGYLSHDEPVRRLFHNGKVHDGEGRIMSKSKGNTVSPIVSAREFGVDASRVSMFFFAPSGEDIRWSDQGAVGGKRFVQRVWDLVSANAAWVRAAGPCDPSKATSGAKDVRRLAHTMLQRFDNAFSGDLAFNTGIAGVYEVLNAFPSAEVCAAASEADRSVYAEAIRLVVSCLAPFAPHLAEECHEVLGGAGTIFRTAWPTLDRAALVRDEVEIAVQVNGKIKARVNVSSSADDAAHRAAAFADPVVASLLAGLLAGKEPKRVVIVRGRLVNIIL